MLPWELILGEKRTIYSNSCMRKTMSFDNSMTDFSQQSVVFAMERFARAVANMDDTVMVPCKLMDVPVGSDPQMDQRVPRRSRALIRRCQAADLHTFYSMLNTLKNDLVWGRSREETDPDHLHTSHSSNGSGNRSSSGNNESAASSNRSSSSNNSNGSSSRSSDSNGSSHSSSSSSNGSSNRSSDSNRSGNCSSSSSSKSAESPTGSSNRSSRKSVGRRPSINSMTSTASVSSGIGYSDSDSESGLDQESTEDSGPEAEESIQRVANQFRRHLLGLHQCLEQLSDAALYLTHRYQVEIGNAD